jgi:hypothetical protein
MSWKAESGAFALRVDGPMAGERCVTAVDIHARGDVHHDGSCGTCATASAS